MKLSCCRAFKNRARNYL